MISESLIVYPCFVKVCLFLFTCDFMHLCAFLVILLYYCHVISLLFICLKLFHFYIPPFSELWGQHWLHASNLWRRYIIWGRIENETQTVSQKVICFVSPFAYKSSCKQLHNLFFFFWWCSTTSFTALDKNYLTPFFTSQTDDDDDEDFSEWLILFNKCEVN